MPTYEESGRSITESEELSQALEFVPEGAIRRASYFSWLNRAA